MGTGLIPYPTYKPSGEPWLGDVPEHWTVRSLGSLTRSRSERGRPDLPLLSVLREKGVVLRSSLAEDENRNVVPEDLSNYKLATAGDLVINKMKAWQGSLGIAPVDGIVSPAYYVLHFRIERPSYGEVLLRSRPYVDLFNRVSDGVRPGQWDLSIAGMKRLPVLVPPPDEQELIVRFLAHKYRNIASLFSAYHRLVGVSRSLAERRGSLVNEYRTRLVADVVTGKLDVRRAASALPDAGRLSDAVDMLDRFADRNGTEPDEDDELAEVSA